MSINPMTKHPMEQPIKRFKELLIDCDESAARVFFQAVLEYVRKEQNQRWRVDVDGMSMLRGLAFEDGLFCSIILLDGEEKPYADVTIKYEQKDHRIWLCNIVPCQVNMLSIEEYNNVLDRFRTELVEKCIGNLTCLVTSDSFVGADVMSAATWKQLKAFSDLANRSSLHPYDNQRWHRFVISAFHNDQKLDGDTLSRILHFQLGWNAEKTFELVIRYEDEIALLREFLGMPL